MFWLVERLARIQPLRTDGCRGDSKGGDSSSYKLLPIFSYKPSFSQQTQLLMFSKSFLSFSLTLLSLGLVLPTSAHPGEHHHVLSHRELLAARATHDKLQSRANHCGNHARAYMQERKAKRALRRRGLPVANDWIKRAMEQRDITAADGATPHKNYIQNQTCVLNEEVAVVSFFFFFSRSSLSLKLTLSLKLSLSLFLSSLPFSKPTVPIMSLMSSYAKITRMVFLESL